MRCVSRRVISSFSFWWKTDLGVFPYPPPPPPPEKIALAHRRSSIDEMERPVLDEGVTV